MNHSSIWRCAGLGLAALAISLSLQSCGSTGHAEGDFVIPVPFTEDIRVQFTVGTTGERQVDVNGGPARAGRCLKIKWYDEDGNEVGVTEGSTDQNGIMTGSVPDEAKTFYGEIVSCPPPDPGKGSGAAKMFEPPSSGDIGSTRSQSSNDLGAASDLRDFIVFGGPLSPNDDPTKDNLTFGFQVRATDSAQVEALLDPILQGGIGTPVPDAVDVLRWSTMEATLTGGRLTTAQPGQYEVWSFDFNDGAFTADLLNNVTRYTIGDWDVVEAHIPLSAFDQGVAPGATYENHGVLSHKTDLMPAAKVVRDGYEYSN